MDGFLATAGVAGGRKKMRTAICTCSTLFVLLFFICMMVKGAVTKLSLNFRLSIQAQSILQIERKRSTFPESKSVVRSSTVLPTVALSTIVDTI